MNSEGS